MKDLNSQQTTAFDGAITRQTGSYLKSLGKLSANLRAAADRIDRLIMAAATPEELDQLSVRLMDDWLSPIAVDVRDLEIQDDTLHQFLLESGRLG